MIYSRPSYIDLNARIAADLATLPAVLREPLSAAWARACHGLHGHLDWSVLQTSPLTCELERLYDYAALYAVPRLDATAASGFVTATGLPGATVLAGSIGRASNGLDYWVPSAVTVAADGTVAVPVRCTSTGAATNVPAGLTLTLVASTAGIGSTLTVAAGGLTGGADDELVDDWRARVADEWQTLTTDGARGGKPRDYVYWARAAHPSVTGALVQLHTLGLGTVIVRPVCNGLLNRLPTAAVLSSVSDYLTAIAPLADVRVVAPVMHALDVTLALAPAVNTAANQSAIFDALSALVLSESGHGAVIALAEVDGAVSSVTTQYTRLAPIVDAVAAAGEVFVLQPIVWA